MDFLNQTYIALRGPAETVQRPHDTVSKLADRLAQSTQLEDRRAALFALRGLSRDYRAEVGEISSDALLSALDGDAQVDPEVAKAVLQTLNTLCEVDSGPESNAAQRETALKNTDRVLQDPKHTQKLFGLLTDASYYTRYGALQLLNTIVANRRNIVQSHFINAPENSQTVTSILEEKRDIIRNGMGLSIARRQSTDHVTRGSSAFPGTYRTKYGYTNCICLRWCLRISPTDHHTGGWCRGRRNGLQLLNCDRRVIEIQFLDTSEIKPFSYGISRSNKI
jgi:hypothetical protein